MFGAIGEHPDTEGITRYTSTIIGCNRAKHVFAGTKVELVPCRPGCDHDSIRFNYEGRHTATVSRSRLRNDYLITWAVERRVLWEADARAILIIDPIEDHYALVRVITTVSDRNCEGLSSIASIVGNGTRNTVCRRSQCARFCDAQQRLSRCAGRRSWIATQIDGLCGTTCNGWPHAILRPRVGHNARSRVSVIAGV